MQVWFLSQTDLQHKFKALTEFMSDNLADFLNDNAGVVTGVAGLAVHRNITATNKNLTALRGELGKLQERFAQEKRKEARESLNRDMLFQISQQVESLASADPSPDQYFELLRVSEEFKKLGLTSATFNSLQDKSYLSSVSSSIDQTERRLLEVFPEETRSLLNDALEWNSLYECGEAIAIADQQIPESQQRLSSTKSQRAELVKNKASLFTNKLAIGACLAGLTIGGVFALLAFNTVAESDKFQSITAEMIENGWNSDEQRAMRDKERAEAGRKRDILGGIAAVFLCGGVAGFVLAVKEMDKQTKANFANIKEADRVIKYLEDHITWLRGQRTAFARHLSDLRRIPPETIEYFRSELTDYIDRFDQLDAVSEYLKQVCAALRTEIGKLPRFPEREAKGGHLARRS